MNSHLDYLNTRPLDNNPVNECIAGSPDRDGEPCDLLIFALPDGQGSKVWKEIRSDSAISDLPVAILTVKNKDVARILVPPNGADNTLKKTSPAESVAHIKKVLRGVYSLDGLYGTVEVGGLVIDPSSYRITRAGNQTTLSRIEFRLLYYLAGRPNRLFFRDQLYGAVWRRKRPADPRMLRTIDVYIRRLRMKIEADPEHPVHLKTVRGVGYLFNSVARPR